MWNPFSKQDTQPAPKPTEEVGVSGVTIQSGLVLDEFLPELRGDRGRKMYREMADNDAVIGAILYAIDMILRSADWMVEAPEDAVPEEAEQYVQFLESVLFEDMSHTWEDTISEILSFLVYGWSYFETVYKKRADGYWGVRKLAPRAQLSLDKWEMDEEGGIAGMWQYPPNGGAAIFIPIEKSLLFRTRSAGGNPEGRSVLRNAYKSYHILKNIQMIEAIGIERELAGLPVVRIPAAIINGASNGDTNAQAQLAAYKQVARDLKFNDQGALIIPSDTFKDPDGKPSGEKMVDIELMSSSGSRAIDTGATIRRYQSDIAMTVMADFILLGLQGTGSFALSENKTDMFTQSLQSYLNNIASVFNAFLVPRLWAMNGFKKEVMPHLRPGSIRPVDLAELGEYVNRLAGAGMPLFPDDRLSNYLRDKAGLPEEEQNGFGEGPVAPTTREAAWGGGTMEAIGGNEVAQKEGLNGAQIRAILDVMDNYTGGSISSESAIEMIIAVGVLRDSAERMLAGVKGGISTVGNDRVEE